MSSSVYGTTEYVHGPVVDMESASLLKENLEINNYKQEITTNNFNFKRIIIISIVCIVASLVLLTNITPKTSKAIRKIAKTSKDFGYTLNRDGYSPNQYFLDDAPDYLSYAILSDTIAVIEPYADMYLYPKSGAYSEDDLSYYHYHLCAHDDTSDCVYGSYYPEDSSKSTSVNVQCSPHDKFTLTVNVISINNEVVSSNSGLAKCLYVRREIRDLTDKDLDATMTAMHELWAYDSETGKEIYGDDFISAKNLLEMHYFQASWRDTDHSHEGLAFLSHHLQMTNFFENSVQLVDPSVTVPYWDYTRDSYQVSGVEVSSSPMYSNKTFGSIQPPKQWKYSNGDTVLSGAIPDSLWAYQIIEPNTKYPDMNYGYSYMRSPWSSNPSPYVSRFTYTEQTLPKCSDHYETFSYDTLADYLNGIELGAHGNAHFVTGGVLGCDVLEPLVDEGVFRTVDDSYEFCQIWVLRTKFWYRDYVVTMKQGCYVEDNDYADHTKFNCGMVCDDSIEGKEAVYAILADEAKDYLKSTDSSTLEILRQFICYGDMHKIITGDQFISSSAADPAFWPIHPTLERLYHAKLMTSGFSSTQYPDDYHACSYPQCYDMETQEYGYHASCCDGHYSYGQMFDYDAVSRSQFIGLTNVEFLSATDATSTDYTMTYVYDNFQWPHCSELADIDGLLAS
eukprot:gene20765-26925_t